MTIVVNSCLIKGYQDSSPKDISPTDFSSKDFSPTDSFFILLFTLF